MFKIKGMFPKILNYESFLKPRNSLIKHPPPLSCFTAGFKGIEGRVNKRKE